MVKTAKNKKLKKIIAGVAATTMVIAAGSALAVSAANYYTFDPSAFFKREIDRGYNMYDPAVSYPYAYNNLSIPMNVSAKSYVRMSCAGQADVKVTNNYSAVNYARNVNSDSAIAKARPYSMNMSVTRGSNQIDNYYTAQ